MQRFFSDFNSLDRFTLNLDYHRSDVQCEHCLQCDAFVSHGIIYKQCSIDSKVAVGKRLFCSNRYGRSGCGCTVQLYLANYLPRFRYHAAHLFMFISCLLVHKSVRQAYQKATGQPSSRNAWRWLRHLFAQLFAYRLLLHSWSDSCTTGFESRVRRLQLLLPTLEHLCHYFDNRPCSGWQIRQQCAFM